jgi:hypothetical protein
MIKEKFGYQSNDGTPIAARVPIKNSLVHSTPLACGRFLNNDANGRRISYFPIRKLRELL